MEDAVTRCRHDTVVMTLHAHLPLRTTVGLLLGAVLLAGCTPLMPRRDAVFDDTPAACVPVFAAQASGAPSQRPDPSSSLCWHRSAETYPSYEIIYAEFDDQGWTAHRPDEPATRTDRLTLALERLRTLQQRAPQVPLSLVVYVNGWRHDAAADDDDVREFRGLLASLAEQERLRSRQGSEPTRVVGLYVGWRGQSVDVPGLDTLLTFWDRKATAERVATGAVRELFSRLDAWRDNLSGAGCSRHDERARDPQAPTPTNCVRMMTIGHSLGGLIVLQSLAGEFVRQTGTAAEDRLIPPGPATIQVPQARPRADRRHYLPRHGDLVLVVNPAIEGARIETLHQAARRAVQRYETDQLPVLISATSQGDWATGIAFPLARLFSTALQSTPTREQFRATVLTPGHDKRYLTHDLSGCEANDTDCQTPACPPWAQGLPASPPAQALLSGESAQIETRRRELATRRYGIGETYCTGMRLRARDNWQPQGNPFWQISVTPDVIADHGDLYNPRFLSFVRTVYGLIVSTLDADNTRPPAKP